MQTVLEKGKISAFQMGIMIYSTVLSSGVIVVPSLVARHAGRDLWISPMLAALIGILMVYVACRLNDYYPKETIIQYSVKLLGTIPGKVVGFFILFHYWHNSGFIVRQFGEFLKGSFLPKTPILAIMGGLVAVGVFAVRGGIEALARSSQIIAPAIIVLVLLIILLLIPDLKPNSMLPIMEKGLKPPFMGSVSLYSWFNNFILISFLLPYVTDRGKGMKWGVSAVAAVMTTLAVTNLITLFLLGGMTDKFTYPVMVATRYISIAGFLEHLESLVIAIWVLGLFIQLAVTFYVLALGTAQWLGHSDYKPIVLPFGLLILLSGIWAAPDLLQLSQFVGSSYVFYTLTIRTAIPLLLLGIALMWKRKKPAPRE